MATIRVHDRVFTEYLSAAVIQERVTALATQINEDYAGKKPLFLAILNGSFMFAADLFKQIRVEAEISFIKIASYQGMRSTGQVVTSIGMEQ
ncbi:MAG: hypoxanthine phosphoribosyltransferase, partial [Chitinophagaceae bacterium]|nr:hypoxanthine phosphoribosyltransferase [Chitinophagaceae bacterium]